MVMHPVIATNNKRNRWFIAMQIQTGQLGCPFGGNLPGYKITWLLS